MGSCTGLMTEDPTKVRFFYKKIIPRYDTYIKGILISGVKATKRFCTVYPPSKIMNQFHRF